MESGGPSEHCTFGPSPVCGNIHLSSSIHIGTRIQHASIHTISTVHHTHLPPANLQIHVGTNRARNPTRTRVSRRIRRRNSWYRGKMRTAYARWNSVHPVPTSRPISSRLRYSGANQLIVRTVLCPQSNNALQRKICTVPLLSEHPIGRLWR